MTVLFNVGTDILFKLAMSLLSGGEEGIIEKLLLDKVGVLSKDKLVELLLEETPLGAAKDVRERFAKAVETQGASEFKRIRNQWLNLVKEKLHVSGGGGLAGKIQKILDDTLDELQGQPGQHPQSGDWKWSKSRQEWLNEDWRHDWRSQPRNLAGRWIPGRLSYIFMSRKAKKVRSARRRAIRKSVREMMRNQDMEE